MGEKSRSGARWCAGLLLATAATVGGVSAASADENDARALLKAEAADPASPAAAFARTLLNPGVRERTIRPGGGIDQLAGNGLRTRDDEAGIRVEKAAHDLIFLDQRELFLDLGRRHQARASAEGPAGIDLALQLGGEAAHGASLALSGSRRPRAATNSRRSR